MSYKCIVYYIINAIVMKCCYTSHDLCFHLVFDADKTLLPLDREK